MHRYLAGLVALVALGLSVYNASVTPTGGWIGMTFRDDAGVIRAHVALHGPAAHAGIRSGEAIDFDATALDSRIAASGLIPHTGATFYYPVERNGAVAKIAVTSVPDPADSRAGLIADLCLALLYTSFCLIVVARAAPGRTSTLLAWILAA
jgi:hypothetical protein